jgi:hypothetical protein
MRQILIPILLVAQLLFSCEKEEDFNNDCKIRYTWNSSEKLTAIPHLGIICFYDTPSDETINQIIDQHQEIKILTLSGRHLKISIDSDNCAITENLFAIIKNDSRISNCNITLLTEEGFTFIITDRFVCKLKSSATQNQLMELVNENRVQILESNKSGDYHIIRADKNSFGDALDMANLFFESGYFEWTEPEFYSSGFRTYNK